MRRRTIPNFIGDVCKLEERQERTERVMQMLGVTPEYPYTFNINDGTRNRVQIGVIGSDYGIQIVDNAGNSILLANGTIVANAIKAGTLDCDLITVANLSASVITTGTLSASLIKTGTLNCGLITVSNLRADSITVGQFLNPNDRFTSGSLSGVKISDGTITGNKIQAYSITADNLATNSISTDKLQADAVTADKINVSSLSAISADIGTITAGSITASIITAGTLNVDRIANSSILNVKLGNDISASKITAGTLDCGVITVSNLSANSINSGQLTVGGSGAISMLYLRRSSSGGLGNVYIRWEGGSRIWADTSNRIGINSIGSPMYIYVNSWDKIIIPEDGQTTIKGGLYITATSGAGNLNVEGNMKLDGHFTDDVDFDNHNLDNVGSAAIENLNNTTINGNNIWYWNLYYYSDISLKKNIKERIGGISDIAKLRVVDFQYKKDKTNREHIGFIAGDVEKVLPTLVGVNEKGEKGVNITEMIPLLVEAVKELKSEIDLLKKQN